MIKNTPIRKYKVGKQEILVKREDLACPPPGPPFAKVRGLLPVLKNHQGNGVKVIGYMETTVSMAGWGISYFCKQLGMKSVIFKPVYQDEKPRHEQLFQEKKWKEFGADIISLEKPNRLMINWYRARKILQDKYQHSVMLMQGLPFSETVEEIAKQIVRHKRVFQSVKSLVTCIGSGTMTAGIIKGLDQIDCPVKVYGVIVAQKNLQVMNKKIHRMAGLNLDGFFAAKPKMRLVDAGYVYTQKEQVKCPFPCNPYYDRKAWKWLVDNIAILEKPILFWNIGA